MIPIEKLTEQARLALARAQQLLVRLQHQALDAEHLLLVLLGQAEGLVAEALRNLNFDRRPVLEELHRGLSSRPSAAMSGAFYLTGRTKATFDRALALADESGDSFVGTEHLLVALLYLPEGDPLVRLLRANGLDRGGLETAFQALRRGRKVDSESAETKFQALEKYGIDLTRMARDGKLDPVVGRDEEVQRLMEVICRRTKNNPVLIGKPGVGKTAVVEGLRRSFWRKTSRHRFATVKSSRLTLDCCWPAPGTAASSKSA